MLSDITVDPGPAISGAFKPAGTRRLHAAVGLAAAAVTVSAVLATAPAAAAAPAAPLRYHTISLPGSLATIVIQINDKGAFTGDYVPKSHPRQLAGFIDAHGHVTSFSYPTPAWLTRSIGINNQEATVGFSQHGRTRYQGWLRSPSGRFTRLNDPAAGTGAFQGTEAESVNDHGVVAGVYITSRNVLHGFVWRSGRFATVNVPHAFYGKPGWGSGITCINNAGDMVGVYTPSARNLVLGYGDDSGHITSITGSGGTRSGDATYANAISNTGVITGNSSGPSGVQQGWVLPGSGFILVLQDPQATTAPSKSGASGTIPEGINRHGVVVGIYYDAHHFVHSFLVATAMTGDTGLPSSPAAADPVPAGGSAHLAPTSRLALLGR